MIYCRSKQATNHVKLCCRLLLLYNPTSAATGFTRVSIVTTSTTTIVKSHLKRPPHIFFLKTTNAAYPVLLINVYDYTHRWMLSLVVKVNNFWGFFFCFFTSFWLNIAICDRKQVGDPISGCIGCFGQWSAPSSSADGFRIHYPLSL